MLECTSLYVLLLVGLALTLSAASPFSRACKREPDSFSDKLDGDDGYSIELLDSTTQTPVYTYEPNEIYNVRLSGSNRFEQFFLVAVPQAASNESESLGKFLLGESAPVTNLLECPKVLTNADGHKHLRTVLLQWKAPAKDGRCVEFRATVVEYTNRWFKDDGRLKRSLCKAPGRDEFVNVQMAGIQDCCACETATYEMQFYGNWSRNAHPTAFPEELSQVRWSSIIGASHDNNYVLWHYGGYSSPGVQQLCEQGNTAAIESELFRNANGHTRSIIKTRDIPALKGAGLREPRFAVFSVNRSHHLVSLLASPRPSPDWCVGVSALDLCQRNCTWAQSVQLQLHLWDAGSSNNGQPAEKIVPQQHRNQSVATRPFATVKFVRKSPYLDSCAADASALSSNAPSHDQPFEQRKTQRLRSVATSTALRMGHRDACQLTHWSDWSICSATCGIGVQHRRRKVLKQSGTKPCPAAKQTRKCTMPPCSGVCRYGNWSPWSPCSTACGRGTQDRVRVPAVNKETMEDSSADLCPSEIQRRNCVGGRYCEQSETGDYDF